MKSLLIFSLMLTVGCSTKSKTEQAKGSDYRPMVSPSVISPQGTGDGSNVTSEPGSTTSPQVQQLPTASP